MSPAATAPQDVLDLAMRLSRAQRVQLVESLLATFGLSPRLGTLLVALLEEVGQNPPQRRSDSEESSLRTVEACTPLSVPESERWIYQKPETLQAILAGIESGRNEPAVDLGSFAQYLHDDPGE